jgi:hypothetical protein
MKVCTFLVSAVMIAACLSGAMEKGKDILNYNIKILEKAAEALPKGSFEKGSANALLEVINGLIEDGKEEDAKIEVVELAKTLKVEGQLKKEEENTEK